MEFDNRITARLLRSRCAHYLSVSATAITVIGFLAACTPQATESSTTSDGMEEHGSKEIAIIITLDVSTEAGTDTPDPASLAATRHAVEERLKQLLSANSLKSLRTYENLPAIALTIDPSQIGTVLSWPEVKLIERDSTLELQNRTFR